MLAATGLASQDIAEGLYLSVRTVNNHLQHAYTKLGVSSRADLAQSPGGATHDAGADHPGAVVVRAPRPWPADPGATRSRSGETRLCAPCSPPTWPSRRPASPRSLPKSSGPYPASTSLSPIPRALGARHAGYGVHTADYQTVGAALLDALAAVLGDGFDAPTRQAWALA